MLALPTFQNPGFAMPKLKVVASGPLRYQPARSVPMFWNPERLAGVAPPVLRKPEMALPRLARPDCCDPMFWKPELPRAAVATFQMPELLAPTLAKPDALPSPRLKKPDDGPVVALKKPAAGLMSMSGIWPGPKLK